MTGITDSLPGHKLCCWGRLLLDGMDRIDGMDGYPADRVDSAKRLGLLPRKLYPWRRWGLPRPNRYWDPPAVLPPILVLLLALAGPLAVAWAGAGAGAAPESPAAGPMTIDDAVRFGLDHNPLLGAASDRKSGAEQGLKAARAEFLPKLDAGYGYTRLGDEPLAKIDNFAGTGQTASFQTSDTSLNRWQLGLRQPLFRGFGPSAQYEIARLDLARAEFDQDRTRLDLVLAIQRGFIQVVLTERVRQVVLETIEQLQLSRRNAQSYFRQGLSPENDVLKADVALAEAQQREREVARQAALLRAELNRLLGLEDRAALELRPWDQAPPADERAETAPPLEELHGLAEHRRPELLALDAAGRQGEEQQRLAKSGYYPWLSLVANAYREGDDFLAGRNDFTNSNNAAVGLRVDWNLFEGGKTQAEAARARYRTEAIRKTREDFLREIRVQVDDARRQLEVTRANLKTAKVAVRQAEENRRITLVQYREQVVVFSEVLDAEVSLTRARTSLVEALYGYQLAWVELERATGGPLPASPAAVATGTPQRHQAAESNR